MCRSDLQADSIGVKLGQAEITRIGQRVVEHELDT